MADAAGPVELLDIAAFNLGTPTIPPVRPLADALAGSLSAAHDTLAGHQAVLANELTLDVGGILDGSQSEFIDAATPGSAAGDDADLRAAQEGYAELRDELAVYRHGLSSEAFDTGTPSYTPPPVYGNPGSSDPDPGAPPI